MYQLLPIVKSAYQAVADHAKLPTGYSIFWSGQFAYMETARQCLMVIIPLTVLIGDLQPVARPKPGSQPDNEGDIEENAEEESTTLKGEAA
jgi:hypothetical protein